MRKKIKLTSAEGRDAFLLNSPTLKQAPEARGIVFLRKDQHPVYLAENKRLRKQCYDLKRMDENNKDVKVGKLKIDGAVVDKNSFLF